MQAPPDDRQSAARSFAFHVGFGWGREWLTCWTSALSAARLLLAAHRRGVPLAPVWPIVEANAAALLAAERAGSDFGVGSGMADDAKRGRLWRALMALAIAAEDGTDREPSRREIVEAAVVFPWNDLPEGRRVCAGLALGVQAGG